MQKNMLVCSRSERTIGTKKDGRVAGGASFHLAHVISAPHSREQSPLNASSCPSCSQAAMPRTIPWLKDADATATSPKPAAIKRRRVEPRPASPPSSPDIFEQTRTPNNARRNKARDPRSPSTSPPPAPPKQEFMRPGWDQDDAWRMVTDEFTATAQLFTAHLAHAEYRRQKTLARKREAALGGADAIARPVVGQLSKQGQMQKQGELQRANISANLKAEESDDEAEAPWMGTHLAGLMMSPSKRERLVTTNVKGRSSTRAAAGFNRALPLGRGRPLFNEPQVKKENTPKPESDQDSTDDDLDLDAPAPSRSRSRPPPQATKPRAFSPQQSTSQVLRNFNMTKEKHPPALKPNTTKTPHPTSSSSTYSSPPSSQPPSRPIKREPSPPIKPEPDWGFGFPTIPQPSQSGLSAVQRRRETRLKREREEKERLASSQVAELTELPTFLF